MEQGMTLVATSLFLVLFGAAETGMPADTTIEAVANRHYALVREHEKRERAAFERSSKAMEEKNTRPPTVATGFVRDRLDQPVPDARIVVANEGASDEVLGESKTDAKGRFRVHLKSNAYRGLTLTVEAKGFERWACGGRYGGLVDFPVRLDRAIDDDYFAAIQAETARSRRVCRLLDLVGNRFMGNPELPLLYPRLGAVRQDLLAIALCPAFAPKDDRGDSPAGRAKRLLIFWHDPDDMPLIRKWVAENPGRLRLEDKSAATIEAACQAYVDGHFGHGKERPSHDLSSPVFGPGRDHALIEFTVRYAHWGYSEYLVLVKHKDQWRLKLVSEHRHMDFD
jgi:hypothetical protein